jgi:hypothetical protein
MAWLVVNIGKSGAQEKFYAGTERNNTMCTALGIVKISCNINSGLCSAFQIKSSFEIIDFLPALSSPVIYFNIINQLR